FVVVDVARRFAEQFVAGLGVDLYGDLVRHGARRHEQGRLFAQEGGDAVLESVDGWVFIENVVADLCRLHGGPHGRRRLSHGIAAQVDQAVRHEASSLWGRTVTSLLPWAAVDGIRGTSGRPACADRPGG